MMDMRYGVMNFTICDITYDVLCDDDDKLITDEILCFSPPLSPLLLSLRLSTSLPIFYSFTPTKPTPFIQYNLPFFFTPYTHTRYTLIDGY